MIPCELILLENIDNKTAKKDETKKNLMDKKQKVSQDSDPPYNWIGNYVNNQLHFESTNIVLIFELRSKFDHVNKNSFRSFLYFRFLELLDQ